MIPIYPRKIKLENPKLKKLIIEKAKLVLKGRAKSEEIEVLERQMERADKKIQAYEETVDISDLKAKGDEIVKRVEECTKQLKEVEREIYDRMKKDAPKELYAEYEKLKSKKDEVETERNKFALKVQKYKDKIIPMARKIMKPFLEDEFEDYNGIDVVDGELVATIFSHLEDFRTNFLKIKK